MEPLPVAKMYIGDAIAYVDFLIEPRLCPAVSEFGNGRVAADQGRRQMEQGLQAMVELYLEKYHHNSLHGTVVVESGWEGDARLASGGCIVYTAYLAR